MLGKIEGKRRGWQRMRWLVSITDSMGMLLMLLSCFSCVWLCETHRQHTLSLGFSRQEYWSGLPFPSPMHEKWKVKGRSLSRVRLFATLWTAAYQAPPSMGFSRQEYWSGVPLPSPSMGINVSKLWRWWGQGSLACHSHRGHKESDTS